MKFINLLKKELTELLNKQMLIGLVITFLMLFLIGQITTNVVEKAINDTSSYTINICDQDDTDFTHELIKLAENYSVNAKAEIKLIECNTNDYPAALNDNNISYLIIIPKGFTDKLNTMSEIPSLQSISIMKSAAALANMSSDNSGNIGFLQTCIKELRMNKLGLSKEDVASLQMPVIVNETTVVQDKSADISMNSLMNNMMSKNMAIPIIIFILVMFTSQMIINAISTEKIDKTLETLLSAPVSRTSILSAKMLAAAIISLLNAVVYMVGFSAFVTGAALSAVDEQVASSAVNDALSMSSAMSQLGLTLSVMDYLLIGVQMFLTIMICLAVSIILGAMVEDAKSAQTMLMPIMIFAMVPYLISMITDVNMLSPVIKTLVYAIPFTHTFTAMNNLMFGNYTLFIVGIIYQAVLFVICMFFALRLFNSDKIFTASINFGQKSKFKKYKNAQAE